MNLRIIENAHEFLGKFAEFLPPDLFKTVINHAYIAPFEIEPHTLYVFCRTDNLKVNVIDQQVIPIEWTDVGCCFYDLKDEEFVSASSGLTAVLLVDRQGNRLGYYFPELKTVWASDWSHSSDSAPAWPKLAKALVKLLQRDTKCAVCGKEATTFFPVPLCAEHSDLLEPRSQKAKGLTWLVENGLPSLQTVVIPVRAVGLLSDETLANMLESRLAGHELFVRACPVHPRHGILESEPAPREEAVAAIRRLAEDMGKAGEGDGDIAVQPFVGFGDKVTNIVWGPGAVAAAPGHDGVTAGRHPQITLRAEVPTFYYDALRDLGLKEAEIEAVVNESRTVFTQVRAATGHFKPDPPPPNAVPGFAPYPINLNKATVIEIRDLKDVMELEALEAEGDVAVIHYGGSILSHAAAWCRERGYAYAALSPDADRPAGWMSEPARGWVVFTDSPPEKNPAKQTELYLDEFRHGLESALNKEIDLAIVQDTFRASIVFHHYATQTSVSSSVARFAGWFTGILARTGLAINYGELRHTTPEVVGDSAFESIRKIMDDTIENWDRDYVYRHFFKHYISPDIAHQLLDFANDMFEEGNWPESYGGSSWAKIAYHTMCLWDSIGRFLNEGEDNLSELVGDANRLLNLVHNTGWAFNKVAYKEWLDLAEEYPSFPISFIRSLHDAVHLLLEMEELDDAEASPIAAPESWLIDPYYEDEEENEEEEEEELEEDEEEGEEEQGEEIYEHTYAPVRGGK